MYKYLTIKEASKNIIRDIDWKHWLSQFMDDFRYNPCSKMVNPGPSPATPEKLKCLFAATVYYLCKVKICGHS
jgi:hypothetical protein